METTLTAIETDIAANEVLHTAANALLTTIDADTDAIKTSAAALVVDLAAIEVINTNAEVHLGNIDTGVDVLEACVGSNKVNVNISSGNISGFATQTTLAAAEFHLGNVETKLGTIETDIEATNTLLTTMDAVMDTIKVDTEAIETAVEILSANQTKTVTQLLYGTGNLVANGTPESSSNSVEMLNNGERVTTFIEGQNVSWDAFNEWSHDNSTWVTDTSLNFSGSQNILYHDFKKGKYLRVKVNNTTGTSGDTNSFVVNIVQ